MDWHERYDEPTGMILDTLKDFLRKEVRPVWRSFENKAEFPADIVKKMADLGFFGLTIPEEYGGLGQGTLVSSLVARELAYEWPSLHLIWTANASLAAYPIMYAGTEEQKQRYLPRLASGEILGCYALTEADAGSDAGALKAYATSTHGKYWRLNGTKTFITNAEQASLIVVFARTGAEKHSISAFLVDRTESARTLPECSLQRVGVHPIHKWGLRSSIFCEVTFEDAFLPYDALLGEQGQGFKIAMATLDGGRINIAAQAVGIAARVLDEALAYVKRRKQFGRAVWENQGVQFDFAEWYAELQAAWALVERVSRLRDEDQPITQMASAAKLFATETAKDICWKAAEYFGGMGYTKEFPWLGRVMDVFPTVVYEGTSNIQKIVIARGLAKA